MQTSQKYTFDYSEAARLTSLSDANRQAVLSWLSKQAEEIRVQIMLGRFHEFHRLKKDNPTLAAPFLDYCALIRSCCNSGWRAQKKFRTSKSLGSSDLRLIKEARIKKAKEAARRVPVKREALLVHWGKVVEMKREGLSFRAISQYFEQEVGLNVSHMTIWKCWKLWQSNRVLPGEVCAHQVGEEN